MHTTKAFRNGNSQAVRIPAELAFERTDVELEIERIGDELRIRPVHRSPGRRSGRIRPFLSGFHA
ncbi:AbrB/MazE/SpoVT family DNA-binding domain-containing protein [Rhizobium beringeri]